MRLMRTANASSLQATASARSTENTRRVWRKKQKKQHSWIKNKTGKSTRSKSIIISSCANFSENMFCFRARRPRRRSQTRPTAAAARWARQSGPRAERSGRRSGRRSGHPRGQRSAWRWVYRWAPRSAWWSAQQSALLSTRQDENSKSQVLIQIFRMSRTNRMVCACCLRQRTAVLFNHFGRTNACDNIGAHGRGGAANLDGAEQLKAVVLHRHHARLDLVGARARGKRRREAERQAHTKQNSPSIRIHV